MNGARLLMVTADDFGIGPETSRGILELGQLGALTATVLIVTSPHAAAGVAAWRAAGAGLALGWHPCLTMDRPLLPAAVVPSLVDRAGQFLPRGALLRRLACGRVRGSEVRAELAAQLDRFIGLVGGPPPAVNFHHHLHVFPVIGAALRDVLAELQPRPYLRRVREPWRLLRRVPGAALKRVVLGSFGRWSARRGDFPGNDWLAGITDPPSAADPEHFARWLREMPGAAVELMCHPGCHDDTLLGRDCTAADGWLTQRTNEFALLRHPDFRVAIARAGFRLAAPDEFRGGADARRLAA